MAYGKITTGSGRTLTLTPDSGWVNDSGEQLVPGSGTTSLSKLGSPELLPDYASPIDVGGSKGYRVKGSPNMVRLDDGRVIQLHVNPDLERARELQNIELQSKRAGLEHQQLANRLTLAQIADLQGGSDPTTGTPALAQAAGVPVAPGDPLAGMSRKSREAFQAKSYATGDKLVSGIENDAREAGQFTQDAQRFQQLNANTTTGPVSGSTPVAWLRKAFGDSGLQEMDSIASKLVPRMRVPGSGTTSDFDARMFQRSTVGVDKDKSVNDSIAAGYVASGKNQQDRAEFMRAYLEANGTLRGADQNWTSYINANPIFDPSSPEAPRINPNRVNWRQFFAGGGKRPGQPASARPPLDSFVGK